MGDGAVGRAAASVAGSVLVGGLGTTAGGGEDDGGLPSDGFGMAEVGCGGAEDGRLVFEGNEYEYEALSRLVSVSNFEYNLYCSNSIL